MSKSINNIYSFELYLLKIYDNFNKLINNKFIHYGDFNLENKSSISEILEIIYKPSNIINKITIVEGWSKIDLDRELSKYFDDFYSVEYEDIIADTYYFEKNKGFEFFLAHLKNIKNNFFSNLKKNYKLNNYTNDEIMIIGSLLEKEGLDEIDKEKIYSVIYNRLQKGMKLQIDATVLFAITDGKYNLNRKLYLDDLKIDHPFNTYKIYGLPPKPISYAGKKTLELIFRNYQTEFLFYFFNKSLNKHIFSKNFKDHNLKLNEYRKKK